MLTRPKDTFAVQLSLYGILARLNGIAYLPNSKKLLKMGPAAIRMPRISAAAWRQ